MTEQDENITKHKTDIEKYEILNLHQILREENLKNFDLKLTNI